MQIGLHTLILSPDREISAALNRSMESVKDLATVTAVLPGYPSPVELARLLRSHRPESVWIDFGRPELAIQVMQGLAAEARDVPVVAFHRVDDSTLLREAMRAGARDFLTPPFREDALRRVFSVLKTLVAQEPPAFGATEHIYTFLPSKPGVGATTLAINTCVALRRDPEKVLLADLDLSCGMTRFLLKLNGEYSVTDAASRATSLDEELWPQLVAQRQNLDVLDSGPMNPNALLRAEDLRLLIDFARRRYLAICLDLSGNLEQYSLEAMDESREVFLVCTPDPASLQLGKEKLAYLESRNLRPKTSVLLNRVNHQGAVSAAEVEEYVGIPVRWQFGNYYHEVQRAVQDGSAAHPDSKLGREARAFAAKLLDRSPGTTSVGTRLRRWLTPDAPPVPNGVGKNTESSLSEISLTLG